MNLFNSVASAASSAASAVKSTVTDAASAFPTEAEIRQGLTEALNLAASTATSVVSAPDGFLKNESRHIPIPKEYQSVASVGSSIPGLAGLIADFEICLNRAAEKACQIALTVLGPAIGALSFDKAIEILKSDTAAATAFFQETCRATLYEKFIPIVQDAMQAVGLYDSLKKIEQLLNSIPFSPVKFPSLDVAPDVTNRALDGLFGEFTAKEMEIRTQPGARATQSLQKVFAFAGSK